MKKTFSFLATCVLLAQMLLPGALYAQELSSVPPSEAVVETTVAPEQTPESTPPAVQTPEISAEAPKGEEIITSSPEAPLQEQTPKAPAEKTEAPVPAQEDTFQVLLGKVQAMLKTLAEAPEFLKEEVKIALQNLVEQAKALIAQKTESATPADQEISQAPEAEEATLSKEEINEAIVQPAFLRSAFRSSPSKASSSMDMVAFDTKWASATACSDPKTPGCIIGPKQEIGAFTNPGDIQMRKLVSATATPGEYTVDIAVRGKAITSTTTTTNPVCAVVVFDRSESMGPESNSKRKNAVAGAKSFASSLRNANTQAQIGLVTFSKEATIDRNLEGQDLKYANFRTPSGGTNLHGGLLKAQVALNKTQNCANAKKYVVIISDGEPTYYYAANGNIEGNGSKDDKCRSYYEYPVGNFVCEDPTYFAMKPSDVAKQQATIMKEAGIEIFSIGYETTPAADDVLTAIASTPTDKILNYYFKADATGVAGAFENIATTVNTANAGTNATLTDTLGEGIIAIGDASVAIGDITEEGFVHSFKIRINPELAGDQAVSSSISLSYTDPNGQEKNLILPTAELAKIHWELPKCSGDQPTGEHKVIGSANFSQSRENDILVPAEKTWSFDASGGACSWSCDTNFHNEEGQCVADTKDCELPNGNGTQTWANGTWGDCTLTSCATNFHNENNQCVADTKAIACKQTGAPDNASYTVADVEVTWDATTNAWNEASNCAWSCNANFHNENNQCVADTKVNQACTGLIDNAHWTMQGVVNQTWNGQAWVPSTMGTYTQAGDLHACGFICNEGYLWNPTTKTCKKPSQGGGGGGTISVGGGGGGVKDNCPNGDFSPSYYDHSCGIAPNPDDAQEVILSGEVNDCSIDGSRYSDEENTSYMYACQKDITTIKHINDARLGDFLTRAEMAKMVTHFAMSQLNKVPNAEKDCSRFDPSIEYHTPEMIDYMKKACQLDIMGVNPDYTPLLDFMPNKYVSRAEFGTILSRVLWGSAYEGTDDAWYQKHLSALKTAGIMSDITPTVIEYRSRIFIMMYRSAKALNLVK